MKKQFLKIHMLQIAIKYWNKKHSNNFENFLLILSISKELENVQGKLMLNPSSGDLWLQEQSLQEQIYICVMEQEMCFAQRDKKDQFFFDDKNTKFFQLAETTCRRKNHF